MLRVSRTRTPAAPGRVRRAPRAPDSAGGEVSVQLSVTAIVTQGTVSEDDLVTYMRNAIERYHLWRNGWVGIEAHAKMKLPKVARL